MAKVTFLQRVSNTGGQAITLNELATLIREDARTKQATQAIQREHGPAIEAGFPEGKKSYQNQKSDTLSAVQLSGFNPDRSSGANLSNFQHSGLIVLDIDDQGAELQAVLSAEVRKHQSLTLCAQSVSGIFNGNFWAAFKVEVPQGEDVKQLHKDWHSLLTDQLNKAVGVKLKGNDSLKRLRYITHDPDLFFNPDAEALPFELLKQWRAKKAAEVPQVKRKADFTRYEDTGNDIEHCINQLQSGGVDITDDYQDWVKIGMAFANEFGEGGRDYFHRVSAVSTKYDVDACNRKYNNCLKTQNGQTTIGTFFHFCKQQGLQLRKPMEGKSADPFEDAVNWARAKGFDYVDGQEDKFRKHIAYRLNWYGVPQVDAQNWVETNYPGNGGIGNSVSGPYKSYASDFGKGAHVLVQRAAYKAAEQAAGQVKSARIALDKGQYLSDKAQYIFSLLNEHKKIHLQAGTGSGKSYMAAVELAKHTDRKIVIACSLNAKVMKDAEQYNVAAVTGELMRQFDRQTILNTADAAQVVLCSYEQVPRMATRYGDEDPVFVVDESHSLSYSYRARSLNAMWAAVERHNVIAMTGTPLPYLAQLGFFVVKVQNERNPINLHLRHRLRGPLSGTAVQHIAQTDFDTRRVVCLINSKAELTATRKALLKKGFKRSEVVTLYSSDEVKATKEFKRLIEARGGGESFADAVKVVLTTSLIGEGVDVYSSKEVDFLTINREQKFNPIQLVQFADRWRAEGEKQCFLYLLEADEAEDWQQGEHYRAGVFFALRNKYFAERCRLYNSRIEKIEQRCLDQRLFSTGSEFSEEEKYITRSKETGTYSVCVPGLIAQAEGQRHKHRTQASALNELRTNYPYFNIIDEREAVADVTDADVHIAVNQEADERDQAKAVLSQLTQDNLQVLMQAVALKSQDTNLKKQRERDPSLDRQARELHEQHPALFERYLGRAEGVIKRLLKARELGITDEDYKRAAVGRSAERVGRFIEGLRLQLLLFLYLNRNGDKALTVQQMADGAKLAHFVAAVQQYEGEALTATKLKQLADTHLGSRARRFTHKQAVTIAGYFFRFEDARTSQAKQRTVLGTLSLSDYLKRENVREIEPVLRRYEKFVTCSFSVAQE